MRPPRSTRTRSPRASSACPSTRRRWSSSAPRATSPSASCCPALYNLAHEGSLPERFNLIGVSRSRQAARGLPARDARVDRAVLAHASPTTEVLDALLEHVRYVPGTFDDASVYETLAKQLEAFDEEAGIAFNRVFYLSTAPDVLPRDRRGAGRGQAQPPQGRRGAGRDREAVRLRPRLGARKLNRDGARGLRRAAGLPHRPLPGQGDRPERAGVPLRQRDVRAGLEPQLHRLRPDHRRPRTSASARAPATTTTPARCATSSRTTCSSCSALLCMEPPDRVRRRPGARREGQGPAGDPAADARGGPGDGRARPVRPGRRRRRAGPGLPRGGRRPARLEHRDLRGAAAGGQQLALGGRPVLPAHRQAPRRASSPRSR